MEDFNNNEQQPEGGLNSPEKEIENIFEEENELSVSDKLIGVFTEPAKTFEQISKTQIKVVDWLIPVFVFIVAVALSTIIMQTNPQIKYSLLDKQMETIQKSLDNAVSSGRITQDQADEQLEKIRERMETGGPMMLFPQVMGIVIFSFIIFFIISGFFYGITKFFLKGTGNFNAALVAYGLPFHILTVQTILQVIIALLLGKIISDLSLATLLGVDKTNIGGFLLSKLDAFTIWFYVIVGIGFAKMFKSDNVKKYVISIVGLWLGFSLLFFILSKTFSFMNFLG